MSSIGSPTPNPAQIAALQAAAALPSASKARDREKTAKAEQRRALEDHVELRVEGLETNTAVRSIPKHSSEQEREEREGHEQDARTQSEANARSKKRPPIDLKA